MERIVAIFPQLIPAHLDVHAVANTPAVNIDMFGVLSPMVKGKAPTTKLTTPWLNKWGASLSSAVNGGQWTQTRKAKVAKWAISDVRCQLCFKQPGTTQHRFCCETTAPFRSAEPLPKMAEMAKTKISCERFELIRNRGVGVIRLPAPKIRVHGTFRWLRNPTGEHNG